MQKEQRQLAAVHLTWHEIAEMSAEGVITAVMGVTQLAIDGVEHDSDPGSPRLRERHHETPFTVKLLCEPWKSIECHHKSAQELKRREKLISEPRSPLFTKSRIQRNKSGLLKRTEIVQKQMDNF